MNNDGYGVFKWVGKNWRAHRVSWVVSGKLIPEGFWVLHHCDNPVCVNPAHLRTGTPLNNTQDMIHRGRVVIGVQPKHQIPWQPGRKRIEGVLSNWAILTEETVLEIWKLAKEGMKQTEISKMLNVKTPTVNAIVSRRNWKHLP